MELGEDWDASGASTDVGGNDTAGNESTDQPDESQDYEVQDSDPPGENHNFYHEGLKEMEDLGLVDIGGHASWHLSSFKTGFGLEALRSDDPRQFWQSDGAQPHSMDLYFSKRVLIHRISIYTDFLLDESYTPSNIVLWSGTGFHDLREVTSIDMLEPRGWTHIMLNNSRADEVLKTFLIRLTVTANHQNGKDTHIRALKVYSSTNRNLLLDDEAIGFSSIQLLSESTLR